MIQDDLERAGEPYRTADGASDFHALRHSFLSHLARSGAHPKTNQELARNSTVTLSPDRYTHLELLDLTATPESVIELPERTIESAEDGQLNAMGFLQSYF